MEATELNIIKPYLVVILYLWTHLYNHLCIAFVLDLHIAKAFSPISVLTFVNGP